MVGRWRDQITLSVFHENHFFKNHLLKNIIIISRQIVGMPMCINCAPLIADFVLFCCERDIERGFMMSLSDDTQADIIEAFNSASRYLDDL